MASRQPAGTQIARDFSLFWGLDRVFGAVFKHLIKPAIQALNCDRTHNVVLTALAIVGTSVAIYTA